LYLLTDWLQVFQTLTKGYLRQYGLDGWMPTTGWIFQGSSKGTGFERILAGKYKQTTPFPFKSEDGV
jgi:hypothetical protein